MADDVRDEDLEQLLLRCGLIVEMPTTVDVLPHQGKHVPVEPPLDDDA